MLRRGGEDESPIERGSSSIRVAFVPEGDVDAAIHEHAGSRARTLSPLPDISAEEKRQASLLEQVASEAASSASRSASSSKVASEAKEPLGVLEGSGSSSSSSVSTSRQGSGTASSRAEHRRISTPKEKTKKESTQSEGAGGPSPLQPISLQHS